MDSPEIFGNLGKFRIIRHVKRNQVSNESSNIRVDSKHRMVCLLLILTTLQIGSIGEKSIPIF